MKVKKTTEVKVLLQLDEDDAVWLKQLCQNPITINDNDEDVYTEKKRNLLYVALHEGGV